MSTHEDLGRAHEVSGSSDRNFGLTLAAVLALLALWPLVHGRPVRVWAAAVALLFLIPAIARPSVLHRANLAWMRLGLLLARVTNPIVMGVVFFVVIVPAGIVRRVAGKAHMRAGWDAEAGSYWIRRDAKGPAPETMSRQY